MIQLNHHKPPLWWWAVPSQTGDCPLTDLVPTCWAAALVVALTVRSGNDKSWGERTVSSVRRGTLASYQLAGGAVRWRTQMECSGKFPEAAGIQSCQPEMWERWGGGWGGWLSPGRSPGLRRSWSPGGWGAAGRPPCWVGGDRCGGWTGRSTARPGSHWSCSPAPPSLPPEWDSEHEGLHQSHWHWGTSGD